MRKLLVVVAALAAAACGGGGGTATSNPAKGTIGGVAFSPVDVAALSLGPKACNLGAFGNINAAGVAIQFASTANVCADLVSATCVAHANSQGVTVFIANAPFSGDATLTKGVYNVVADTSSALTSAGFKGAFAESHDLGAACAPKSTSTRATGTVELTEASATRFAGHVNITFDDGSKLAGDFSAPTCAGSTADICQIALTAAQGGGTSLCSGGPTCQ